MAWSFPYTTQPFTGWESLMNYLLYPFLFVHSVVGWTWTVVSLTLMSVFAYLTRPEGREAQLQHYHRWAQGWGATVAWVCRVRIEVEGAEHFEAALKHRAVVIAPNHQSFMDIPILLASVPGYFAFVSKAEVFAVPVLGPYMEACGFIKLRRFERAGSREAMSECAEALMSGRSVLMFPEGTRSDAGELLPFKKGAAVLAARAQVPILPIALEGSSGALPKGTLLARPASVVLRAGPLVMPPADGDAAGVELTTRKLHQSVRRLLDAPPRTLPGAAEELEA